MLKKITNINNIITRNEQALLMDRERNVPHFAQNAAKGPLLPWSQITPLDGGTTQIRLDGEIVDCVQVGVTNVKFAVTDGRVKEFSCMFSSVAFENYSVTHSLTYSLENHSNTQALEHTNTQHSTHRYRHEHVRSIPGRITLLCIKWW